MHKVSRLFLSISLSLFGFTTSVPFVFAADGSGTMSVTPSSVVASTSDMTFLFDFNNTGASTFSVGSEIELTIPAGWTTPQTTDSVATGYMTATNGADSGGRACDPGAILITGDGPWGVAIPQICAQGSHLIVSYSATAHAAGTYAFETKSQHGDSGLTSLIDGSPSVTVTLADQTITFAQLSDAVYGDVPVSLIATASSSLMVSFESETAGVCTVGDDAMVHIVSAGTCTIRASQSGNGNYNAASNVDRTFTVNKAMATITFGDSSYTYDSAPHGATISAQGVLDEDLSSLLDLGASFVNLPGGIAHWTFTGGTNYNDNNGDATVTIDPTPLVVTAVANIKTVDSSTSATAAVPTITSGALQGSDTASFIETYDNADVGTGKTLTPSGTAGGNSGNNYSYSFVGNTNGIILAATQIVPETADDGSGTATIDSTTPEVVITDPDQAVMVTVDSGTTDPTVDVSAFIDVIDGETTGTLPEITINSDVADMVIPDNTVVTGPADWDGIIDAPTDAPSDGTAPAGFTVGDTVISVGSPDGTLTFDKAVKITLTGVTGTVGYKPAGSDNWVTIDTQCTDAEDHGISFPGECYSTVGGDTIIWTYHFTEFGGFDEIVPPVSPVVNPGGHRRAAPDISATPAVSGVTSTIPATPVIPQGQVLGATTYNFTKALTVGSRGADVTALQQYLIDSGYSVPSGATGYFGRETRAAVIAFQKARGIAQAGVVGPLTRAELNRNAVATSASSNLSSGQASAIIGFLQDFDADQSIIDRVRAILGL